jgi:hypothetical protein
MITADVCAEARSEHQALSLEINCTGTDWTPRQACAGCPSWIRPWRKHRVSGLTGYPPHETITWMFKGVTQSLVLEYGNIS